MHILQHPCARSKPEQAAEASIDVLEAGGLFGIRFTIHKRNRKLVTGFSTVDRLQCPNCQRAWYRGYQSAWNWLDEHAPGLRLVIRETSRMRTAA
jgi:hypothetical protein